MTLRFVAYIDKAGDEGLGKLKAPDAGDRSRWLFGLPVEAIFEAD